MGAMFKRFAIGEFKRFFLYYASILLFPVIVSTVLYFSYTSVISKDMISSGNAAVKQMQMFIDSKIYDVLDLTAVLMQDKDIVYYASFTENEYTPTMRYNSKLLYPKIDQLVNSSEYIENIYVFFPKSHSIIADSFRYQGYSADLVSNSIFKKDLNAITEFLNTNIYRSGLLTIENDNMLNNLLIIARPVVDTKSSLIVGLAAVTIRMDKLCDLFDSVSYSGSSSFLVSKDNNKFSSSDNPINIAMDYNSLADGVDFVSLEKNEFAIACSQSSITDLKYVFVTPLESFFKGVNTLKTQLYYYVLLCLLLGSLFVWIAATRSYRPIDKLLKMVSQFSKSTKPFKSEYMVLEKAFTDLLYQHKTDELLNYKHELVIRDANIKNALQSESNSKDYVQFFNTYFNGDKQFYVLYFVVKDYSPLIFDSKGTNVNENVEISMVIIKSLAEELFSEKGFHAQTVMIENNPVCLIGSANSQNQESDIKNLLVHIAMIVKENFGLNLKISISDAGYSSNELPRLYSRAKDAADYLITFALEDVCYSWANAGFVAADDFSYMDWVEYERALIIYIKNRDIQHAAEAGKNLLNLIIAANPPINMNIVRNYISRVKHLVWTTVNNITHYYDDDNFMLKIRPYERMESITDIYQLQNTISDIFYELEDYITNTIDIKRSSIVNGVIEIIDNHYMECDLSVAGIAEIIGKAQSYISRLFIEDTGDSISEYIHRVRIAHVKDMLAGQSDSALKLQIIAEQSGFTNTWTMNRIFRKYEQITPGEYRKVYKNV